MRDPEENINHQEDKSLEIKTGLEAILEIALDIHKIEKEGYQEDPIGPEINLDTIQVTDQRIEPEMIEIIQNQTNIVKIVIKMVILGNIVGRCKPMQRKQEGFRRWMIEMMTHQAPSTPW